MRYASRRTQEFTRFFIFFCLTVLLFGSVHHDVFAQSRSLKKTIVDPLIRDHSGKDTLFVETFRCTIKTKTVIFYVDSNFPGPSSLHQEIQRVCGSIQKTLPSATALDLDRDGLVEVRIAKLKSSSEKSRGGSMVVWGQIFLNNIVKGTNGQRDIVYLDISLFWGSQQYDKWAEVTFLHENQHLRQLYQYFCSTMKQCDVNTLNAGNIQFAPEVRAFIEGDAVRASCQYLLPSECLAGYPFPIRTTNVQRDATCFTELDFFGYICAYRLVEKINKDFKEKLKLQYKNADINPILEVLKKKNALQSLPLFKKALDEVFKKYTTIDAYDVYGAERDVRSGFSSTPPPRILKPFPRIVPPPRVLPSRVPPRI